MKLLFFFLSRSHGDRQIEQGFVVQRESRFDGCTRQLRACGRHWIHSHAGSKVEGVSSFQQTTRRLSREKETPVTRWFRRFRIKTKCTPTLFYYCLLIHHFFLFSRATYKLYKHYKHSRRMIP